MEEKDFIKLVKQEFKVREFFKKAKELPAKAFTNDIALHFDHPLNEEKIKEGVAYMIEKLMDCAGDFELYNPKFKFWKDVDAGQPIRSWCCIDYFVVNQVKESRTLDAPKDNYEYSDRHISEHYQLFTVLLIVSFCGILFVQGAKLADRLILPPTENLISFAYLFGTMSHLIATCTVWLYAKPVVHKNTFIIINVIAWVDVLWMIFLFWHETMIRMECFEDPRYQIFGRFVECMPYDFPKTVAPSIHWNVLYAGDILNLMCSLWWASAAYTTTTTTLKEKEQ